MKFKRIALALAALIATAGVAALAQTFPNLPLIGGASYCAGYSSGPTGQVCNVTVPAGPTVVTGSETFPVDTNLASGAQPQTAKMSVRSIGAGATQYSVPLTGATTTIAATTRQVIINPAGTIAAHTLVFPAAASLTDGQRIGFCTTQIVTALTTTPGTGLTISNAPTAMLVPVATGAASCVEWQYVASATTLFRVQ